MFEALDTVLGEKGFVVNVLLRLTMPDCLINFSMACSRCPFRSFALAMFAMVPWIVAHAWYGAQIESLTDKVGNSRDELINLIIGLVATTVLGAVLVVYTRRVLGGMIEEAGREEAERGGRGRGSPRVEPAQNTELIQPPTSRGSPSHV